MKMLHDKTFHKFLVTLCFVFLISLLKVRVSLFGRFCCSSTSVTATRVWTVYGSSFGYLELTKFYKFTTALKLVNAFFTL